MTTPYRDRHVEVAAHRGASGYAPENTVRSFSQALAMNAHYIELDVHMSLDGEIVVIHDARVDRTTDGTGSVGGLTLRQLRELDAGSWFNRAYPKKARPEFDGQKIPVLQEVIDLVKETKTRLYVEIKDPGRCGDLESRVVSLLRRAGFLDKTVILSFSVKSIMKIKTLDSSIRTACLVNGSKLDVVAAAADAGADVLALRHTLLTPEIVEKARQADLGISVWTVNSEIAIRRAIALGADCIISNYPDRAMRTLAE